MPTLLVRHDLPIADALRDAREGFEVIKADDADDVREHLARSGMFITNPTLWDDSFLDGLEAGDWIQSTSAGYDGYPIEAFRERGIAFSNASGNYGPPVSEHVFALAFAHSRRLPAFLDAQRVGEWRRELGATTTDWTGRTLTVYGIGDIGEDVARRGKGFDFEVYGVKRDPDDYDGCLDPDRVVGPDGFHDLLPSTDLLAVVVPLTDETRHSVDADVFEALPDTAFVVNVARGPVIDEAALIDALRSGRIGGAGLDVFVEEPLPPESPLWDLENAILTPHIGGRSDRFVARAADLFLENYDRRRAGEPLVNRIV